MTNTNNVRLASVQGFSCCLRNSIAADVDTKRIKINRSPINTWLRLLRLLLQRRLTPMSVHVRRGQ
jgi:hypothetical protein